MANRRMKSDRENAFGRASFLRKVWRGRQFKKEPVSESLRSWGSRAVRQVPSNLKRRTVEESQRVAEGWNKQNELRSALRVERNRV